MPFFDRDLPARFGPYAVRARLGVGGMAEAFLAQPVSGEGAPVVVKRLLPQHVDDARARDMLLREGRVGQRLVHENIVRYLGAGVDGTEAWVALEYLPGLSGSAFARRHWQGLGAPLPVVVAARIAFDAARGLQYAHTFVEDGAPATVIHRDISPDNLMVTRSGVTKVLDFGIVRAEGEQLLTRTGEIKGKLGFFPPELLEGDDVDARGDIFSLGVTLYWLLTGKRPFTGQHEAQILKALLTEDARPAQQLRPDVPVALDALLLEMLARAPADRVQSAELVARRLAAAVDVEGDGVAQVAQLCEQLLAREEPEVTAPGLPDETTPDERDTTVVQLRVLEDVGPLDHQGIPDTTPGSPPHVARAPARPGVGRSGCALIEGWMKTLPDGLDSWPEATCKGSLIRSGLAYRDPATLRAALPPALHELVDRPPASSMWLPETHHVALMLALCAQDGSEERFLESVFRTNVELLSGPLYRTLLKLVSPRRGFRFCAKAWAQMHRGTEVAILEEAGTRVRGVMRAPAGLFPRVVQLAFGEAFRAALIVGGAKELSVELESVHKGEARYEIRWALA